MSLVWLLHIVMLQTPVQEQPQSALAKDVDFQQVLRRAMSTNRPALIGLAQVIERIITDEAIPSPEEYKHGATAALAHCVESTSPTSTELYLRLLQQPVLQTLYDQLDLSERINIDGQRDDWPKKHLVTWSAPKNNKHTQLTHFGATRSESTLLVVFETDSKPTSDVIHVLEISTLADRFRQTQFTIKALKQLVKVTDVKGDELTITPEAPIMVRSAGKVVELAIPTTTLSPDLRSVAMRGYVASRSNKRQTPAKSPWLSCPTGSITTPVQVLIGLAQAHALHKEDSLPVAVALQEGLLIHNSHEDLSERIQEDAGKWLSFLRDILPTLDLLDLPSTEKYPAGTLLAWANRYSGHAYLESIEDYEFVVPTPQTLAKMRRHAERSGWLSNATTQTLRDSVSRFVAKNSTVFDFPNRTARQAGRDFEDPNNKAYYAVGNDRLLSYRDVGINLRWELFEKGQGLAGSRAQINEILRCLCLSVGLPTLVARHHNNDNNSLYVICFDAKVGRWFPAGASGLRTSDRGKILLSWHSPWTRPERFTIPVDLTTEIKGEASHLFDHGHTTLMDQKLSDYLNKGIPDRIISKAFLTPLR